MAMEKNLDKISSFPDDILCHIFTFLPMRDAVRTSILSTRWKYLFASMSTLDFHCLPRVNFGDPSCVNRKKLNNFWSFVSRVLYWPDQASLECFRLRSFYDGPESFDLSGWIHAASCRGVKEIDLYLLPRGYVTLPTLLFTCQSLVKLKLDVLCGCLKVPSTVCLPNLKTLHLRRLELTDDSIPQLISSCHVLEDLVLAYFYCEYDYARETNIQNPSLKRLVIEFNEMQGHLDLDYMMVINVPSLVYFQYFGYIVEPYTFSNMMSLEKADIRIFHFDDVDSEQSAIHLLQGICNVRSLYLSFDVDKETLFQTPIDPVLAFHNLVEFEFNSFGDYWRGTWLMEFLHFVPNLKMLILDLPVAKYGFRSLPREVPSCFSFQLKEIKISNFKGDTCMFGMIGYFLDKAIVLEKLKIGMETLCEEERLRVFKKLSSLPRNSKKCKVGTF